MLYRLLRFVSGVALRWYYRDVEVLGAERIPRDGPLLVAGNHPNALVDALVLGRVVPRRLRFTAKATLFEHPPLAALLRSAGAIPLRRASDEAAREAGAPADPERNARAFAAVQDALARGGAVLVFPEGRSHDEPRLSPLRTGLARMALQARDVRDVRGIVVLPVGLTFEDKAAPRSRVLVDVGEPLALDRWRPDAGATEIEALTREVDRRLRAVTLNFDSAAARRRVLALGRALAAVLGEPQRLGRAAPPLGRVAPLARRIEAARRAVEGAGDGGRPAGEGGPGAAVAASVRAAPAAAAAPAAVSARAVAFAERLEALEASAAGRGVALAEALIPVSAARGAWFVAREVALAAVGLPLALWGRVNHWIPLRLALVLGRRGARTLDEPAMRTVVAGLLLVLASYAVQGLLLGALAGPLWAAAYLVTLPASASWDLRFSDRREDALRRVRAYLALRRDPAAREELAREIAALRAEASALDALLP